ncbi:MAG TPA: hypothetical protein VJN67_21460 [Stellaceae bacterium]|nr:hypothetical protein [Stellaceae bacterium]
MGRYSPTVLPSEEIDPAQAIFLQGLREGPERFRQIEADRRAEEEYKYRKGRRQKEDDYTDIVNQINLYRLGVRNRARRPVLDDGARREPTFPAFGRGGLGGSSMADGLEGERSQPEFPVFGRGGLGGRTGLNAPGSFNPATGQYNEPSFGRTGDEGFYRKAPSGPGVGDEGFFRNAPSGGRVGDEGFYRNPYRGEIDLPDLPGGEDRYFDLSQTEEGIRGSQLEQQIQAAIRSGINPDEAMLEIMGKGLDPEHFHPGEWHPHTKEEADALLAQQHKNRLEEIAADVSGRRTPAERDPDFEERKKNWIQTIVRAGGHAPRTETEQKIIRFLAYGMSVDEIIQNAPPNRQAEVRAYLMSVKDALAASAPPDEDNEEPEP